MSARFLTSPTALLSCARRAWPATLALSASLLLAACGGGGSGGDSTASVAVPAEEALPPLVIDTTADKTATALATTSSADPRTLEMAYLRHAVGDGQQFFAHLEVPALDNLRALSDGSGGFLGFRNYQGQPVVNNGVRAEGTVDFPFREGQTVRYSWRFGITKDFQSDPANRWWLFGDLHDQPDASLGQTWADYQPHSPSIGLGYGRINGQDQLALIYGAPNPSTRGLVPFARGVWHRVALEITWSRGADGQVALYLDDATRPVLQASGPNMYNAYQHYLKVGSYRDPAIPGDSWVYVRDLKVERVR